MPIEVTEDLKSGSVLTQNQQGITDTRRWLIKGLTPGPGIRAQALSAVDAVTGKRPALYGEPHPNIANCRVGEIQVTPFLNSSDGAYLVATYKEPPHGGGSGGGFSVSITGTTGTKNLQLSDIGKPLLIPYKDTSQTPNVTYYDYVSIPVFEPGTVICFSWQTFTNLYQMAKSLRKRVNKGEFQGEGPHAWMCRRFDISTTGALRLPGPSQWSVTAEFELDVTANGVISGWQRIETFRDRDTGRVPTDIDPSKNPPAAKAGQLVTGNGFGIYAPPEADFSVVGLPDLTTIA